MRVLYVATRFEYGKPELGLSFEHYNFFESLRALGHHLVYFDTLGLLQKHGRAAMNRRLGEVAKAEKPDLLFAVLSKDELDKDVVRSISAGGQTPTVNWFCDDHWRFDDFSRFWAPCFNWVVTTARSAVPKYEAMGYTHAIKSQWACNHFLYRKLDLPLAHDVTFVGQPHGNRRAVIDALRQAGIKVQAWGNGWEAGRLAQDKMIELFNQSRINLNLSNASFRKMSRGRRVLDTALGTAGALLSQVPGGGLVKRSIRRGMGMAEDAGGVPGRQTGADPLAATEIMNQIKGRNFEIPGCGGFTLTGPSENLDEYYLPDREVIIYSTIHELIEKVRYFLEHEDERARVAQGGYARTLAHHTYAHRFRDIFRRMGLPAGPDLSAGAPLQPKPASVTEVT